MHECEIIIFIVIDRIETDATLAEPFLHDNETFASEELLFLSILLRLTNTSLVP